jgi:hypothetical protein
MKEGQPEEKRPLFDLGQTLATPGALNALGEAGENPIAYLFRHVTGDWGDLEEEDIQENELSLQKGYRLFSAYHLNSGVKIYVITEWDRSVTTILLPEEY